jgi:hypothetical protein
MKVKLATLINTLMQNSGTNVFILRLVLIFGKKHKDQAKLIIFSKLQADLWIISFGAAYIQPSIAENHRGQDFIIDIKE